VREDLETRPESLWIWSVGRATGHSDRLAALRIDSKQVPIGARG
jgi:hypothetical protein